MRPIPQKHRKIIDNDQYYKRSVYSGTMGTSDDRIVIHHPLYYANKQICELFNYIPMRDSEHKQVDQDHVLREKMELVALRRMTEADFQKYSKADFKQLLKYLSKKYA